jgi:hypothetical protein
MKNKIDNKNNRKKIITIILTKLKMCWQCDDDDDDIY